MLALMLVALAAEYRYKYCERLAGYYLNRKNEGREAWGTYWEREVRERAAGRKIDHEAAESARLRRKADEALTFNELATLIPPETGLPLSPSRFVELYRKLPPMLRETVISDTELSRLYWSGNWQRTSLWRRDGGCTALLVDAQNRMVREVVITGALLDAAAAFGKKSVGMLDDFPLFSGRIFTGDRFMEIFLGLSAGERAETLGGAEIALAVPRPLLRIGLAPPLTDDGWGQIGFETHGETSPQVITYPISAAGVNRLLWLLTWDRSDTLFNVSGADSGGER